MHWNTTVFFSYNLNRFGEKYISIGPVFISLLGGLTFVLSLSTQSLVPISGKPLATNHKVWSFHFYLSPPSPFLYLSIWNSKRVISST
jgi:hypothetical protein